MPRHFTNIQVLSLNQMHWTVNLAEASESGWNSITVLTWTDHGSGCACNRTSFWMEVSHQFVFPKEKTASQQEQRCPCLKKVWGRQGKGESMMVWRFSSPRFLTCISSFKETKKRKWCMEGWGQWIFSLRVLPFPKMTYDLPFVVSE